MAKHFARLSTVLILTAVCAVGQGQPLAPPAPEPSGMPEPPPGGAPEPSGPETPSSSALSATVFVMDISGSMGSRWPGGTKIDSAKEALRAVTKLIRHEVQTLNLQHLFGIVAFTTDADLRLPLGGDLDSADDVIDGLEPEATTNVGAGLELGLAELRTESGVPKRMMVLLSDGMTNTGDNKHEILAGSVAECAAAGIPIYVCGYGDPADGSSMDEDFLKEIADQTGGKYYHASNGTELENIYVRVRHESLGKILADVVGTIAQDETQEVASVPVEDNTDELYISLNWPGSWLDLLIYDPAGVLVDAGYQGASLQTATKPVYAIIRNPLVGPAPWKISVRGSDVPEGQTGYQVVASGRVAPPQGGVGGGFGGVGGVTQPAPGPQRASPLLAIATGIILALCAVLAAAIILVGIRTTRTVVTGHLLVATDGRVGIYPINSPRFILGRAETCSLRILDDSVSGLHAEITCTGGQHSVRDLGSRNGTLVNGDRITDARVLRSGDKIRVGQTELTFSPLADQSAVRHSLNV